MTIEKKESTFTTFQHSHINFNTLKAQAKKHSKLLRLAIKPRDTLRIGPGCFDDGINYLLFGAVTNVCTYIFVEQIFFLGLSSVCVEKRGSFDEICKGFRSESLPVINCSLTSLKWDNAES